MTSDYKKKTVAGRRLENYLISSINSGLLKDGDIIESTPKLAERFNISLVTAQKTLKTLSEQGYLLRKNGAPTIVAAPKTRTVGLVMPNMGGEFTLQESEMHYRTVSGILSACNEYGFNMSIIHTPHNRVDPRNINSMGLCGLFILYPHRENIDLMRELSASGLPLLCLNLFDPEYQKVYRSLNFNYEEAGKKTWEYFKQHGRKNPAFLALPSMNPDQHRMHLWEGFRVAAACDGVEAKIVNYDDNIHDQQGFEAMIEKRSAIERDLQGADAILFGITKEAELYYSWGHTDVDLCGFFSPSLHFPAYILDAEEMGRTALKMLIEYDGTSNSGIQPAYAEPRFAAPMTQP